MRKLALSLISIGFLCASVSAQGLGALTGSVTDASGGAVPGAKVTVTETGTGFVRTVETGPDGLFAIPSLRPAQYDVVVEASGFRSFVAKSLVVQADQSATLAARMEVGALTETVSVTGLALQVDTTTATIRQVVDTQQIVELPLNGRNPATLTLLVPGAVLSISNGADQGQTKTFPGAVTVSTNGSRQMVTSYMLDGGNNVDEYTNVNAPFPFPDALQEFSVQTSNYNAEYGQNAGGVVNIITRSGTNQFHGNLFEFVRNAEFNARNFFAAKRDQLKRNQFGGTVGGPVWIPHLYNGRDRTFFFFGYQNTRIRNLQGAQSAFVPTPANIAGDFTDRLSASNPANPLKKVVLINDPLTGTPFPGNIIPSNRFDPATLNMLKYLPQGTVNGSVFYAKPIAQNFYDVVAKVDHSFSDKDKLTGRYYAAKFFNQGIYDATNILTYTDQANILSQNALIQETHIFNPGLLNDVHFNYARENSSRGPAPGVPNVADFGVNIYQPPAKAIEGSGISVSGFFSFGDNPPARFVRNNFTLADDVRWVKGRHSMAFGFHGELARVDLDNQFLRSGVFGFTADITNDAVASLMLGKLRTFRQGNGEFKANRNVFLGFYAQDSFRATSRLTLNYGLRYEPIFPWREVRDRVEQFRPDAYAAGLKSQVYSNAPPGLFFVGDPGMPSNGTENYLKAFAPRLGFAYDVSGNGKTSIRGGAGIFYDSRQSGIFNNRFVDVTPFSPQITLTDPKGPFSNPLLGIANPFPAPFPAPKDAAFPLPVLVVTYDPTGQYKPPVAYNWNFAVEHQFGGQWLARAAYVGAHSSHLTEMVELNPAVYTPGSKLSTDARRLFTNYQFISEASQAGNSRYDSLQLSVERRLARSLTLTGSYTWSKSMDNLPVDASPGGPADGNSFAYPWYFQNANGLDRGLSDFDHTQRFVLSYVWQLPMLRDKNSLVRMVVGGWQLTGVVQAQTGPPLTIMAGKDQSQTGLNRDRAVITGSPYGPGACGTVAPCVDYLNVASFALPAIGNFGNVGKGSLRGPGLTVWDVGVFKSFAITERFQFQLRGEFFNALNHANFTGPAGNDSTRATVSAGGFGSIRAAGDPRIGQLALKFLF
jgi:hypothetical protein